MVVRIGTRGSALALAQAKFVRDAIHASFPELSSCIITIKTSGDAITDVPLYEIGGKGLFIKEIEEALLGNVIDIAVHSAKDVPGQYAQDLDIPCVLPRGSARDVFISSKYTDISSLPIKAKIGTSSVRRKVQLLAVRPDLEIVPLRGNIDTRISKMHDGVCDGIILAEAGIDRIARRDLIREILSPDIMLGAVGQGAICVQCRKYDRNMRRILQRLNCHRSYTTVLAERSFLKAVEGDCNTPMAAMARYISADIIIMKCMLSDGDGNVVFTERVFEEENAEKSGYEMGVVLKHELHLHGL
ncbi:hydroxymethylbilane synthase [Candidatus Anaplasma sp. TIGMIC]|uniref:hydroxymethylbilane synthase n=1 Tax=Candidatus Anaplasma sp. TIGMIC TaxID=3020713 RepID=UPI002330E594|nr:hydroxymethylbilane synthase [Candidatus Anaplasma sp. TIGMIC]MDB1135418.1 hydroxymethylbilane synthase [Candidatus Anaplasma sp. TIGMIC]